MKFRKGSLLIDIVIGVMFMSMVLYSGFYLGSSSINKKMQVSRERDALTIAENIMAKSLSVGFNHLKSVPSLKKDERNELLAVENNTALSVSERRAALYNLKCYTALSTDLVPQATLNNITARQLRNYKYHVIVDQYTDADDGIATEMVKVTVRVFYPIKTVKYDTNTIAAGEDPDAYTVKDRVLKEDDFRYVELFAYKTAKN